jgi:hypothetical protein
VSQIRCSPSLDLISGSFVRRSSSSQMNPARIAGMYAAVVTIRMKIARSIARRRVAGFLSGAMGRASDFSLKACPLG